MSVYATIVLSESGHQGLPAELDPRGEGLVYGQNLPLLALPENLPGMQYSLDDLARSMGVTRISTFLSDAEMVSDEDLALDGLPPNAPIQWFPAADGLRTVDALLENLVSRGAPEGWLWDLQASQIILKNAAARGESFYYCVL